jgi:hypothetical protein
LGVELSGLYFHALMTEDGGSVNLLVDSGCRNKWKRTLVACWTRQARFEHDRRGLHCQ